MLPQYDWPGDDSLAIYLGNVILTPKILPLPDIYVQCDRFLAKLPAPSPKISSLPPSWSLYHRCSPSELISSAYPSSSSLKSILPFFRMISPTLASLSTRSLGPCCLRCFIKVSTRISDLKIPINHQGIYPITHSRFLLKLPTHTQHLPLPKFKIPSIRKAMPAVQLIDKPLSLPHFLSWESWSSGDTGLWEIEIYTRAKSRACREERITGQDSLLNLPRFVFYFIC